MLVKRFKDLRCLTRLPLAAANGLSAAAGGVLAGGDLRQILPVVAAVILLAAGCSALNQAQELDLDRLMERTRLRPLPAGTLNRQQALTVSLLLLFYGCGLLASAGMVPLLAGLTAIGLYNGLYTPLKRTSALALLPGALAGAIPPLIGWTAMGGSPFAMPILLLCGALLLWQIPHTLLFFSCHRADLQRAKLHHLAMLVDDQRGRRLVPVWLLAFAAGCALLPLVGVITTLPGRLLCAAAILWLAGLVAFVVRIGPDRGCNRQLQAVLAVMLLACIGSGPVF